MTFFFQPSLPFHRLISLFPPSPLFLPLSIQPSKPHNIGNLRFSFTSVGLTNALYSSNNVTAVRLPVEQAQCKEEIPCTEHQMNKNHLFVCRWARVSTNHCRYRCICTVDVVVGIACYLVVLTVDISPMFY